MSDPVLAEALRAAVRAQDFGATADAMRGGAAVDAFPSLDLALVVFGRGTAPRWANVLFSREHPGGLVADIGGRAGAGGNNRVDADPRDGEGTSPAWRPGADWSALRFERLHGDGPQRVVAPYPASLLKLMVAVGVGLAVDAGACDWPEALEPMIVVSDNEATEVCVALLHRTGFVGTLNRRFAELGLPTLQLNDTQPDGGWRNADGAGVGHIHMTAWDSARLLWLLDAAAPPPPWLPQGTALLAPASRDHLRGVLERQQLDHVLSSGALRSLPGWVAGLPDAPAFAHKTGSTDNYASDGGIVVADGLHYIVVLLSNLGLRYAPPDPCVTTWRMPALGAAVHRLAKASA
jgi:hypothetical protein